MRFLDRQSAGRELGRTVRQFNERGTTVILALPRGGIILGFEVAKLLDAPLGLVLVHKIGHPAYAEYAIGAIAEDQQPTYSGAELLPVDELWLTSAEASARQQIARQRKLYYTQDYTSPDISGKTVIVVDDGMATGLTMLAAIRAVQRQQPARIIVAVPVASQESIELLEKRADAIVTLDKPENFLGVVGAHYFRFPQIHDMTVRQLLERSRAYGIRHATSIHA